MAPKRANKRRNNSNADNAVDQSPRSRRRSGLLEPEAEPHMTLETRTNDAHVSIESDRVDAGTGSENAPVFDADEEYARQLQEEEFAAANGAFLGDSLLYRARMPINLAGLFQMAHSTYRPTMPWIDQDNSPDELSEEENMHRPRYSISDEEDLSGPDDEFEYGDDHEHSSDPAYIYEEDGEESEDSFVDDDDEMVRLYRRAVSRALDENGGEPPVLVGPFMRLFDFLDQIRTGNRMNAIGPFIADEDFDESYEALLRLSERIGEVKQRGLSPEAIAKMKEMKWTDSPRKSKTKTAEARSCPVCLEAYGKDERLMELECSHSFHWACAERWLLVRATCPICRVDVNPPS